MKKLIMILVILSLCVSFAAAAEEGWLTSLEEAKTSAQKDGKDIIMDFTGSDWCGWCIKLHDEVFGTDLWKEKAPAKYVMVVVDFPRKIPLAEEQQKYNDRLKNEFGVKGFPTIYVLDTEGKAYARTGYQKGGPENYLTHLEGFSSRKVQRDELLNKAKETPENKRLSVLEEVIKQLKEWQVGFAYPEIKEEVISLDKDNKAGLRLEYASELTTYYHSREDATKSELYLKMVKEIDADKGESLEIGFKLGAITSQYFKAKDWAGALKAFEELSVSEPEGEAGQQVYYYIGLTHYRLKDIDSTIENLEKALELASESKMAQQIQKALANMKEQQQKKSSKAPE